MRKTIISHIVPIIMTSFSKCAFEQPNFLKIIIFHLMELRTGTGSNHNVLISNCRSKYDYIKICFGTQK